MIHILSEGNTEEYREAPGITSRDCRLSSSFSAAA
jgi:hypothetical protein